MKKIILFLILFFPLNTYARSVTIMDMDTKRVLYQENQNDVRLIASISKIMTSYVAINNTKNIKDIVTINEDILKSFGSGIYIEVGEKISLENLLYGLMLRSGNDAAIAIADYVGGSMDGFAMLMNEVAKNIGMNKTTFINSSGLENNSGAGNMSTSYDMALLMSEAMKNETFRKIVSTKDKTVKTNYKTYVWHNKNKLLSSYKYCTGGKTGFTEKARRTLVTTASKNNMNLVVVTLNDPNDFVNHQNFYEEFFKKYKSYKILDKNTEDLNNKNYYIKEDKYLTLTKKEYKNIKKEIYLYENNISDVVGYIRVSLNNDVLLEEKIYEKFEDLKENKNWIDKFKAFFKKFS